MLVSTIDQYTQDKQLAGRALVARNWFALNGPTDAPPLPLNYGEREALKSGGLPHIVAWFARSLAWWDYDFAEHPSFEDYAGGVMTSEYAPDFIKNDNALLRRFPPQKLSGLGPGLCWDPPELCNGGMA